MFTLKYTKMNISPLNNFLILIIMGVVLLNMPIYTFTAHNFLSPNIWYISIITIITFYAVLTSSDGRRLILFPSKALGLFLLIYMIYTLFNPSVEVFSLVIIYVVAWMVSLLYLNYGSNTHLFKYLLLALSILVVFNFFYPGFLYNYEAVGSVFGRSGATYVNPNMAGEALLILLILAIGEDKDVIKSWVLAIVFFAIFLTFSRSAILFTLLLAVLVCLKNLKIFLFFGIGLVFTYIVLLGILDSSMFSESTIDNLRGRLDLFTTLNYIDDSANSRLSVVNHSLDHFLKSPVFGNGINYTSTPSFGGVRPHNTLLLLIVEFGLIGLAMYIYVVVLLLRRAVSKNTVYGFMPILMFIFFSMFNHDILSQLNWLVFLILSMSFWRMPHINEPDS